MTRDTRRWIALLAGPVAVIGIAIAGAVFRPGILAPGGGSSSTSGAHPFEAIWSGRVTVPFVMHELPPDWLNRNSLVRSQTDVLVGGALPGARPVRTERIVP
jgi:hypothetical protein